MQQQVSLCSKFLSQLCINILSQYLLAQMSEGMTQEQVRPAQLLRSAAVLWMAKSQPGTPLPA